MSIDFSLTPSPRFKFVGSGGAVTFDTDWKNLLVSDTIVNTFNIDAVDNSGSSSPHLRTQYIDLGAVHSLAKVFFGTCRVGGSTTKALGGTHIEWTEIDNLRSDGPYAIYLTGPALLANAVWWHLEISASRLRAVVNYRFCAGARTPFPGVAVKVFAFVGTFDY